MPDPKVSQPNYADTHIQPPPSPGAESVTDSVIEDMQYRRKQGTQKYGTELMTKNGRDALVDAYQEALDLVMYLKQELMERESGEGTRPTERLAESDRGQGASS